MKFDKPLDGFPAGQLVPEYQDASRDAHERKVRARHRSHPIVQLKQGSVQPRPLRLLQPWFPPTHLVIHVVDPPGLEAQCAQSQLPGADLRSSGDPPAAQRIAGQGPQSDHQQSSPSVPNQQMRRLLEHALDLKRHQNKKGRHTG